MTTERGTGKPRVIDYRINDKTRDEAELHRRVEVPAEPDELRQLVEQGYLLRKGLFTDDQIQRFKAALDRVSKAQIDHPDSEVLEGNGHYIRDLMNQDPVFVEVLNNREALAIGRAVLGPQVSFDIEGRIAFANTPGQQVPWHIHLRVVPDPMPPFFCYPHAIHCLLYLDDVGDKAGPICLLPGSHTWHHFHLRGDDGEDKPGQLVLPVKAGDCLFLHGNLWHRTLPSSEDCPRRRLLLFGYTPAWIKSYVARGVKVEPTVTDRLRREGDDEMRELLGGFHW